MTGREAAPRRDQMVDLLAGLSHRVAAATAGINASQAAYRYGPAFPTIREVVEHLRADSQVSDAALRRVCVETDPEVDLRIELEPGRPAASIEDLIEDISRYRRRTVDMLRNLRREEWLRSAQLRQVGPASLGELCQMIALHGAGHVSQLHSLAALVPDEQQIPGPSSPGQAPQAAVPSSD